VGSSPTLVNIRISFLPFSATKRGLRGMSRGDDILFRLGKSGVGIHVGDIHRSIYKSDEISGTCIPDLRFPETLQRWHLPYPGSAPSENEVYLIL
jgi:hypothetical protein